MTRSVAKPAPVDPTLQHDAQALHAALSQLVRIYQFRDRDRICCHDISVTQCHALEALVEQGAMRSQELAAVLRLDKSTTTRVVDALVRKGHVERSPDPDDARAVSLRATAGGRRLYRRINDGLVQQQVELLRDAEPGVRREATRLIQGLTQAAQARFGEPATAACAVSCTP
jgi:MarR family transcriptional regulator, 2-MHQ and catechol-resistance regulon repressor